MHIRRLTLAVALPLALAGPIKLESRGLLPGLPSLPIDLPLIGGAAPAPELPVPGVGAAPVALPNTGVGALPVPIPGTGVGGVPLPLPAVPVALPNVGGALPVPLPGTGIGGLPLPLPAVPVALPNVGGGALPVPALPLPALPLPALPVPALPLPVLPAPALPVVDDYPDGGSSPTVPPGPVTPPVLPPGGGGGSCTPADYSAKYLSGLLDGIDLIGKGYGGWPGIAAYPGAGGGDAYLAKRLLDNSPITIPNLGTNILKGSFKGPIGNNLATNLAGQAFKGAPVANGLLAGLLGLAKE